jgi:hypothetical protein
MSMGCSSTPSEGTTENAEQLEVHTTRACGDLPILGDFAASFGPIPDDCKSCVDAQCCEQANACAVDAGCKEWRDCFAANGCYPYEPCSACAPPTGDSATLNDALNNCRTSCDSCLDLRCAGKPWPAFSAASFGFHLALSSFTATTPFAGVVVKVCGATDHDCTSPLDTATTAADGTVDVAMPTGPGGEGAYLDLAGPSIAPTLTETHLVNFVTLHADDDEPMISGFLRALDMNTWGLLRGSYNFPADPGTRSRFNIQAKSCGGSNLPGVTVTSSSADSETFFGYLAGGIPSTTATETDTSGLAGWENHPAGPTTVTITKASTGEKLLTYDTFVRGGVIGSVGLPPGTPAVVTGQGAG